MSNNKEVMTSNKSKYDPAKTYKWEKDTNFTFTGVQFSIMYNNISQFLTGEINPVNIMKVADAFAVLQGTLVGMVNDDQISEMINVEPDINS